jgi:hypothetical protein
MIIAGHRKRTPFSRMLPRVIGSPAGDRGSLVMVTWFEDQGQRSPPMRIARSIGSPRRSSPSQNAPSHLPESLVLQLGLARRMKLDVRIHGLKNLGALNQMRPKAL